MLNVACSASHKVTGSPGVSRMSLRRGMPRWYGGRRSVVAYLAQLPNLKSYA